MKLAEQEKKTLLHQGGFSQKEIEDWKKRKNKVLKLNGAGFSNARNIRRVWCSCYR